jgi:hypothetical protein
MKIFGRKAKKSEKQEIFEPELKVEARANHSISIVFGRNEIGRNEIGVQPQYTTVFLNVDMDKSGKVRIRMNAADVSLSAEDFERLGQEVSRAVGLVRNWPTSFVAEGAG